MSFTPSVPYVVSSHRAAAAAVYRSISISSVGNAVATVAADERRTTDKREPVRLSIRPYRPAS